MIKKNESQTFRKWFIQNLFAIMAVVVTLANLWLATKLSPLSQGVEMNKQVIASIKQDITEIQSDNIKQKTEIMDELKYIRVRVDSLYNLYK